MIVTLTPNPSLDRTITVTALTHGGVNRAADSRVDPGGKGINVTRAITRSGGTSVAVLPLGGADGVVMRQLLEEGNTPFDAVPISGSVRTNVALVEPSGATTKINEPGPQLTASDTAALLDAVTRQAQSTETAWVVGCGSLPPGTNDTFYADLIQRTRRAGLRIAIDASGAPFHCAMAAHPDLIKPNRLELAELVGRDLTTLGDVVTAAQQLINDGVGCVIVSLGRDGAVAITATDVVFGKAPAVTPVSTVGAGDCTLAGFLLGDSQGLDLAQSLSLAIAFGTAAVQCPGSEVPTPEAVAAVHVTIAKEPDFATVLTD